ncbi:glycosyltransferase [Candidatus Pelagibacter ubique]|nr:glycosyltransferase [Candidatus Pelagibacter ubique]
MDLIVCIPTFNEELNIKKCLNKLKWANKVIILDSNSTDNTVKIAKKFKNTNIIYSKKKLSYVSKLNYFINKNKGKWLLILDADYVLSNALIKEFKILHIENLRKEKISGFKIKIYNKIFNKTIREDIYPKKILLFKNVNCYFRQFGHSEKFFIKGKISNIDGYIMHENFNEIKNFSVWKLNQSKYSKLDSSRIVKTKFDELRTQDKIRKFPPINIILIMIYFIFFKKILIYGKSGFFYLFQRLFYETLLSFQIIKIYLRKFKNFISL